jgi:hypothetical protein
MKIKQSAIAVIILVIIFGGIGVTSALGLWHTTNTKEPARYSQGEFAGEYNPDDIRGSYTFGEISELFGIPVEDLGKAFALNDANVYASFACKDLEAMYTASAAEGKEVGTDSVRIFVALYNSLPITLNDATYFPAPAADVLKSKATLSDEQVQYIDSHTVTPVVAETNASASTTAEPSKVENSEGTGNIIKGSTTFGEVLDWGINKEDIEKIINDKLPSNGDKIKDYATSKGIEFSTLKESLQDLVDSQN